MNGLTQEKSHSNAPCVKGLLLTQVIYEEGKYDHSQALREVSQFPKENQPDCDDEIQMNDMVLDGDKRNQNSSSNWHLIQTEDLDMNDVNGLICKYCGKLYNFCHSLNDVCRRF